VDDLSALVDGVERAGLGPDLAGRNWPNKTSQPRSSAPPASQTDYIAIAPGIGVFDPLRHYGRFTRPPGEVAGPPRGRLLGASGSNAGSGASSADHPADDSTTLRSVCAASRSVDYREHVDPAVEARHDRDDVDGIHVVAQKQCRGELHHTALAAS
jgi:hypothetical protein